MKNYCIYLHKNKINNKVYVGQTCQKPEYRWKEGEGYIQCPVFYRAIKKYGWENFEHIILENNLTLEEANQKEQEYIEKYKSTNSQYGYNLMSGGGNKTPHEKTSQKISNRLKEEWKTTRNKEEWSYIMKEKWKDEAFREKHKKAMELARDEQEKKTGSRSFLTEEGRKKLSDARKQYILQNGTPTQGKGHSEEAKEKIRQSKLGELNPMYGKQHSQEWKNDMSKKMSKKVRCIETKQIFNSYLEAASWAGCKSSSGLSDYFAGRKKSFGKHPVTNEKLHWEKIE